MKIGLRILLCLGLLALLSCGGEWPLNPGGFLNLTLACSDDAQCQSIEPSMVCVQQKCACPEPLSACDKDCVDLKLNADHCGKCSNVCKQSECCNGTCCPAGKVCCKGACVDILKDIKNCGDCGTICKDTQTCCEGLCTEIVNNNEDCGVCGARCPAAVEPITKVKKQSKDGENMEFLFENVEPPSNFATLTLKVSLFGSYSLFYSNAEVYINGISQGVINGGSQCNQRPVAGHTRTYQLSKKALDGGKLKVRVDLSDEVSFARCQGKNPRVEVTLSFGTAQCCERACVDVQSNVEHCGGCGNTCTPGAACCGGRCCPVGFQCCQGSCCRILTRVADDDLNAFDVKHDGSMIMAASERGLWAWDFISGQNVGVIQTNDATSNFDNLFFHPDPPNKKVPTSVFTLAASQKRQALSFLVGTKATGRSLFHITLVLNNSPTWIAAAMRKDGKFFFFSDSAKGSIYAFVAHKLSGNSRTWDVKPQDIWNVGSVPFTRLKTSANGQWLLAVERSLTSATLFEMGKLPAANTPRFTLRSPGGTLLSDVDASPDGKTAALAALFTDPALEDKSYVEFRDLSKLGFPATGKLDDVGGPTFLKFSPDGTILAVGTLRGTIQLWDMTTKTLMHVYHGHTARITKIAFHPKGKLFVSSSLDRTLRIWSVHFPQQ